MAGSVWERKDGRFGAEFRYKAGGLTKTLTTTRATREAADAGLAGKEADRAAGQLSTGSQTVRDYLEEWLKDAVEPSVSRRTHEKRAWAVRLHIAPALGRVRLPDLDAHAIPSGTRDGRSCSATPPRRYSPAWGRGQPQPWSRRPS